MYGRNSIAILGLRSITGNFPIYALFKNGDIGVNPTLTYCIGMYGRSPTAILGPRSITGNFPMQALFKNGDIRVNPTLTNTV